MVRITITKEAHEAIARAFFEGVNVTLRPLQELEDGRRWIWLPMGMARALADLRRPGEDYSQTIIRIANGGR